MKLNTFDKMKKILFATAMILTSLAVNAQSVSVNDVEANANDVATVKVCLSDASHCTATGFYLEFDDGLSIAGVEDVVSADVQSDHIVRFGQISSTKLRIAIYSPTNSTFELSPASTEGGGEDAPLSICDLKLVLPNKAGTFTGRLTGIELANGAEYFNTQEDVPFDIIVNGNSAGLIGDTNGDGKVLIGDVIAMLNYILGSPSLNFNENAADVNGDGKILIGDVIAVLNIIVGNVED